MNAPLHDRMMFLRVPAEEIAHLCGVSVSTAKRWQQGSGRPPVAAQKLVSLHVGGAIPTEEEFRESSRERAARLRVRMLQYHLLYNAAWFVRQAQHAAPHYRKEKIDQFVSVLRHELEHCQDEEALIYAVADSLTAYPRGLPWET